MCLSEKATYNLEGAEGARKPQPLLPVPLPPAASSALTCPFPGSHPDHKSTVFPTELTMPLRQLVAFHTLFILQMLMEGLL